MTKNLNLKTPVRALFIDMDGTMIGPDEVVTPRVRAALKAAHEAGCLVIPCTGRTRYTAQPVAEQIDIPLGYAVTANGAVVQHLATDELLLCREMTAETALTIVREILALEAQVYVYEASLTMRLEHCRALYHPKFSVGPWALPPRYMPHEAILESLPFAPVSVATFGSKAQIHPLVPILQKKIGDQISLLQSGSEHFWGIELYSAGVTKRLGAEVLANHLGIAQEETMAIGDHLNDLAMLEWAGIGVAVRNAQPETKAAADFMVGSVYEDGVAEAVERFVLAR